MFVVTEMLQFNGREKKTGNAVISEMEGIALDLDE